MRIVVAEGAQLLGDEGRRSWLSRTVFGHESRGRQSGSWWRVLTTVLGLGVAMVMSRPVTAHAQAGPNWCVFPRSITIAVVGDYGVCSLANPPSAGCEQFAYIARDIKSKSPSVVLTVGDNSYHHGELGPLVYPPPSGSQGAHTPQNVVRAYHTDDYPPGTQLGSPPITPVAPPGTGVGVELLETFYNTGKLQATLGNHDYHQYDATVAKEFFYGSTTSKAYYELKLGLIDLFAADSNQASISGPDADGSASGAPDDLLSVQLPIARTLMTNSKACWQASYFHHPTHTRSTSGHATPDPIIASFVNQLWANPIRVLDIVMYGHAHFAEWLVTTDDGSPPSGAPWGPNTMHHLLSGGGGARLYGPLPPQAPAVRMGNEATSYSYALLTAASGTGQLQNLKVQVFRVVASSTPGAPEWYNRWKSEVAFEFEIPTQDPNGCIPLAHKCNRENCEVPPVGSGTTVTPTCTETGTGTCGTSRIAIDTPPNFTCPEKTDTIGVRIRVPYCCPTGVGCYMGYCPVVANAYDCNGTAIFSMCLYPDPLNPNTLIGDAECRFDWLTLPCKWEIYVWNSSIELKCPATVEYYCCTDCDRAYDDAPQ